MEKPDQLPETLIPFDSPQVDLSVAGGKGANLIKLKNAGFPVPDGFLIPTSAYREFVLENHLRSLIKSTLEKTDLRSPEALKHASLQIRQEFSQGKISIDLVDSLRSGLAWLGDAPVAVRSSATAEDLPGMSFAGQQDTLLNVIGEELLVDAVITCWSSLWTARAIGYRTRNNIPHDEVSLSVIVQRMVQSEISGVLFTANPLTGLRSEVVIDATIGLGEALVSGQVEPDHYIVDTVQSAIKSKTLGAKSDAVRGLPEGGVQSYKTDSPGTQALPDQAILELARIGKKIEALYEFPQDIEWAWVDGTFSILQSRPITSLYPIPEVPESSQLHVFFSFGAVQGLLDPMTPLGQDAIRLIFAGGSSLFGFNDRTQHTQGVIKIAGERLWGDATSIVRHPLGAKVMLKVFPGVEPGSLGALKEILSDPDVEAGSGRMKLSTIRRLFRFGRRMLKKMLFFARDPETKARMIRDAYQAEIEKLRKKYDQPTQRTLTLTEAVELFREIYHAFIFAVPEIAGGAMPGLLPLLFLSKISSQHHGSNELALKLTRGLPNNVTTEMDLSLWDTAKAIREDPISLQMFQSLPAAQLAENYLRAELPEIGQRGLQTFLTQYGMRGLGEIDIGRPRWRENPTQIIQTIQSYLQIKDDTIAPDAVFRRGTAQAQEALDTLVASVQNTFAGKLKTRMVRAAVRRLWALGGLRESPKFYIVQIMGLIRHSLLRCGETLVAQGKTKNKDDLFFLYLDELEAFSNGEQQDWKTLIRQRRTSYNQEMLRKQVPRMLVSDGRTFYEGMEAPDREAGVLRGSPVSPGVVEGTIRVVFEPHKANLSPGEILVCPGTDPAWTPLFLAASGLIMEVGGMMTHGAIVAREYGIPAVVGVNQATVYLETGDKVRLDGSTGLIEKIN